MSSKPLVAAIAAVARNGVIGRDNALPWHIPEDLKFFKRMTLGKPVIMGRKSYEALGKPLPGRLNIVITRAAALTDAVTPLFQTMEQSAALSDKGYKTELTITSSVEQALFIAYKSNPSEIMITGGAQIYAAAMPLTQRLYLTRIDRDYDGDTWWPALEEKDWRLVSEERHEGDPPFTFQVFDRTG